MAAVVTKKLPKAQCLLFQFILQEIKSENIGQNLCMGFVYKEPTQIKSRILCCWQMLPKTKPQQVPLVINIF